MVFDGILLPIMVSAAPSAARFLEGSTVEVLQNISRSRPPKCALFDFDGTLSLIREGWPQIMIPMMVAVLKESGSGESDEELESVVTDFVTELTGRQTIYQMIRLAEELEARGGTPASPQEYKSRYLDLLMEKIRHRRRRLRTGEALPADYLVPGSVQMLTALKEQGVHLYLASGTDEEYVREEARLLGMDGFFGSHIYGAREDYANHSKRQVIERILQENRIDGASLVGFGDGYVEIENVKTCGGIAIALATDEANPGGAPDPWKRTRLRSAGADLLVPDFRDWRVLTRCLFRRV
jgi:phosphoglycolate phosphatase-like HAD superfamily hydrolase